MQCCYRYNGMEQQWLVQRQLWNIALEILSCVAEVVPVCDCSHVMAKQARKLHFLQCSPGRFSCLGLTICR